MTDVAMTIRRKKNKRDIVFPIVNTILLCVIMAVTLYPVINTVAISFNDGTDALRGGITIWPRVFSTKAYASLLTDSNTYQAFFISVTKTIIITVLNLFLTSMLSFALSRKEYVLCRLGQGLRGDRSLDSDGKMGGSRP